MEFEVQESEEDDKPAEKPQKRLLEDPLHKGSTLPGFHVAKDPPKPKPWYLMLVVCSCLFKKSLICNAGTMRV